MSDKHLFLVVFVAVTALDVFKWLLMIAWNSVKKNSSIDEIEPGRCTFGRIDAPEGILYRCIHQEAHGGQHDFARRPPGVIVPDTVATGYQPREDIRSPTKVPNVGTTAWTRRSRLSNPPKNQKSP